MARELMGGRGYAWKCRKCGMTFEDVRSTVWKSVREEYLNEIRNGNFGEDLKKDLSVFPDNVIDTRRGSYKCPHCNNLKTKIYINTPRPSFNEFMIRRHEHHICNRCSHEMVQVTDTDRDHRLTCPKCGAKMKIDGRIYIVS